MKFRLILTVILSKLVIFTCRILSSGGTSFPGKFARKLFPDILSYLAIHYNIIMITGTNGKTTTTKIIGQILTENGISFITNRSGANLTNGVISTFINNFSFNNFKKKRTALLEIDEAAFSEVINYLEPECLVVTNFFRDQLDRYGELYTTLDKIAKGIEKLSKTKLILNADDSLCSSLGKNGGSHFFYGFSDKTCSTSNGTLNSDAMYCIYCKNKYIYTSHTYGHLGSYSCPNCGYSRPKTQITCTSIKEITDKKSMVVLDISFKDFSQSFNVEINLPGLYNIYNSIAAITCSCAMNLPMENSISALSKFESSFGRMETISASGVCMNLILVKNPTGFNQVLDHLSKNDNSSQLALLVNDRIADGTDISWLWDVDFEKFSTNQKKYQMIYTSGTRAEDTALRLKYAGFDMNRIKIVKNYKRLINSAISNPLGNTGFCILPTYTAMLDLRKHLTKRLGLKEFWR